MTKKGEEANQPLRRRRGVGDFESLVPKQKPHGGFHPAATMGWKFEPRAHRLETNALTEYSDAVVFAWEFLRRNRFYMALVDKKYPRIPETEWGFQYSKKSARTHGLLEVKPYTEHYHEGRPPAWIGLDTFAQRLQSQSICTKPQSLNIELQGEQLVVVLDLGKYFHRSPWREQLFALQDFLEEWERKKYRDKPPEIGRLHKKVLLRRIRLIDFLSRGKNLQEAGIQAKKMQEQDDAVAKGLKPDLLGNYAKQKSTKPTDYEDLDAAYELTYQHHYLKLAGGDVLYKIDKGRMRPLSFKELLGVEEKAEITLKTLRGKEHRSD